MRLSSAAILVCLLVLLAAPGTEARDDLSLPPAVARLMDKRGVPESAVSIWAQDVDTDQVILAFNSDAPRTPASTIKTVTTFAALDVLGPAYTWRTRAFTSTPVVNGTLNGDLYLVGGGDPFMTAERWWAFVRALRRAGLERI
ncbi:MAG TPA: D-alanyl-D-alanine carboxypeptidase, partial [Steroidobacteraceae bacterium]|nr:D-alanyl-D-alanine carboxypeptidase [Steroidobacteraceae bacterium]